MPRRLAAGLSSLALLLGCSDAQEPTPAPLRFAEIATTVDGATCAITTDGVLYCWGENAFKQLTGAASEGCGPFSPDEPCISRPVRADAPSGLRGLTAGREHFCALRPDGTPVCWGSITLGTDIVERLGLTPTPLPGGYRLSQIDAGWGHLCGVTTDGDGVCWGDDFGGVRGTASSSFGGGGSLEPSVVDGGLRFRSIRAGVFSTCAVTLDGTGHCWGRAYPGLLGNPDATLREDCGLSLGPCAPVPAPVAGSLEFAEVSVGLEHACARTADGAVVCWGGNGSGVFGEQAASLTTCTVEAFQSFQSACAPSPLPVANGPGIVRIASGHGSTCFLDAQGRATCLGSNEYGQAGRPPSGAATPIEGHAFTTIAPGGFHTCALDAEGLAWCWGRNEQGQLGNGTTQDAVVPVAVSGPANP